MALDETMDEDMISQLLKEPPILRFSCGTLKPPRAGSRRLSPSLGRTWATACKGRYSE